MWHRMRWFNKQSPDRTAWIPCEPSSTSKTSAGVTNVTAEVTVRGHLWADFPETAMATLRLAMVASCRSTYVFPSSQKEVEERLKKIIQGEAIPWAENQDQSAEMLFLQSNTISFHHVIDFPETL